MEKQRGVEGRDKEAHIRDQKHTVLGYCFNNASYAARILSISPLDSAWSTSLRQPSGSCGLSFSLANEASYSDMAAEGAI